MGRPRERSRWGDDLDRYPPSPTPSPFAHHSFLDFTIQLPTGRHWRSAVFQPLLFIGWNGCVRWRVGAPSFPERQLGNEPRLWSSRCSCIPGCTPLPPPLGPDLCLPPPPPSLILLTLPPPPPTLRPPLISGLRGSRNERSEARWHEEGGGGWVVAGNCSKLRYRDLATLTPLCATPFPVLRSAVPHRRLIYPFVVECLSKIIFDLVCFRIERRENCCAITVENVENASENSIGTIGWNPVVRSPLILTRFDFFVFQG